MMKFVVIVSLFIVGANAFFGKDCKSGADCSHDQCCFNFDTQGEVKKCAPLVKPGKLCAVGDTKDNGLSYHGACPCAEGYECRFGKVDRLPKCRRINGDD